MIWVHNEFVDAADVKQPPSTTVAHKENSNDNRNYY